MNILGLEKFNLKILLSIFGAIFVIMLSCKYFLDFSDSTIFILSACLVALGTAIYVHLSKIVGTWRRHVER